MKMKTTTMIRRLTLIAAFALLTSTTKPCAAQDWECVDSTTSPGGAHGNTIIQLPDGANGSKGSILNTFHIKLDDNLQLPAEWVTRWKANESGASWQTIDHWVSGKELPNGEVLLYSRPFGAASYYNQEDGTIEVFVAGYADVYDLVTRGKGKHKTTEYYEVRRWVVRRGVLSPDSSTWDWQTVRIFGNEWGMDEPYYAKSVAIDHNGTVYVAGRSNNDWYTEVSYDGGDTWFESDRWQLEGASSHIANGITIGLDGAVFASGSATEWRETRIGKGKRATIERTFIQHWITRKLDPATQSWSVVDDYVGGNVGLAMTPFLTSHGILLVGGQSNTEVDGYRYWTLRASLDNGANWSTIDLYGLEGESSSFNSAHSITEGTDGTIYVGGSIRDFDGNTAGIRFTQDLLNWETELFPQEWNDRDFAVSVLAADPNADGGPFLYSSESGPNPDCALIRRAIP